jgi:hypothetical protein
MTTTTKAQNIFTCKHEPFGYLVQSQGGGKYMILRRESDGPAWVRVAEGFSEYLVACACADTMAALP